MHDFKRITFIISASFILSISSANAQVYRWKDASGRTIYGDMPPETASVEAINLPTLTIVDGYKPQEAKTIDATQTTQAKSDKTDEADEGYKNFAVSSPVAGQAVRSNSGNVTVSLTLDSALKSGHNIILYVDGKQYANGQSLSYEVSEIDRGSHSVFAVIQNEGGDIIQNTEVVSFHILRTTKKHSQTSI